jgi:hypothetical protein
MCTQWLHKGISAITEMNETLVQDMNRRSRTPTKGRPVGIRLDEEVLAAVEKLAEEDERSVSFTVNRLLKEALRARGLIK